MKRLVLVLLKALKRCTWPIRRPFQARLETYLGRCLRPSDHLLSDETNVLMDQVVRELVRLRRQVEVLERAIGELAPARERLAIAVESEVEG